MFRLFEENSKNVCEMGCPECRRKKPHSQEKLKLPEIPTYLILNVSSSRTHILLVFRKTIREWLKSAPYRKIKKSSILLQDPKSPKVGQNRRALSNFLTSIAAKCFKKKLDPLETFLKMLTVPKTNWKKSGPIRVRL